MKNVIKQIRQPKVLQKLVAVVVILVSISLYAFIQLKQGRVFIDNSLVSDPIVNIAPLSSQTLQETDVYENEKISKGAPIAIVGGQTLFAQTDGLIIMANNQIGSIVNAQNPVAQMIDLSNIRIAGTIDENKGLSDIKIGQVISFTVDALPGKTFWGYVDEISPSAKQTQVTFSISSERPTQQFVVYARFDGTKYPEIKNGMSSKMTVFTNTK